MRLGRRLTRLEGGNRGSEALAGAETPRYGDLWIAVACVDLVGTELHVPIPTSRQESELIASVCTAFMTQMEPTAVPERGDEQ